MGDLGLTQAWRSVLKFLVQRGYRAQHNEPDGLVVAVGSEGIWIIELFNGNPEVIPMHIFTLEDVEPLLDLLYGDHSLEDMPKFAQLGGNPILDATASLARHKLGAVEPLYSYGLPYDCLHRG